MNFLISIGYVFERERYLAFGADVGCETDEWSGQEEGLY